ncbi:hypothetical protein BGZ46_007342 [Entomortierella lignicola]|nr:hypothetical protein BGZ46_007342 [Entomortierella lignicola]
MHSFSIIFITLALALFVSAQSNGTGSTPPCYQASCGPLIDLLKECQITVDPTTGNINFPVVANTTATTDKCLCTQSIVNAYDPCYTCGAQNQKIQSQFSTQNLVDSCNTNFGANTVKMPTSGSNGLSSSAVALTTTGTTISLLVVLAFFV